MSQPSHPTVHDRSIGNLMIISLLALCGLTFIILLGIF